MTARYSASPRRTARRATRPPSLARHGLRLLAAMLPAIVLFACTPEQGTPDLSVDAASLEPVSEAAIEDALDRLHAQLPPLPDGLTCDGDGDASFDCALVDEALSDAPALRQIFVADEQLTEAGVSVAQELLAVEEHAIDPSRVHATEIRAHLAELNEWQGGRALLSEAPLTAPEREWLARVWRSLSPNAPIDTARLTELTLGTSEPSIFPRQVRAYDTYRAGLVEAATVGHELNVLLLRGLTRYARIQKFDYTYTAPVEELIERELLYPDPEDIAEEEFFADAPPRSREYLEPWRIQSLKDAPVTIDPEAVTARERTLLHDRLRAFLVELPTASIDAELAALPPNHEQYRMLQAAFARYRALAEAGGWASDPVTSTLKRGSTGEDVVRLRRRLTEEGFLAADSGADEDRFDSAVEEALLEFQESNQLPETGVSDAATRRALQVLPRERLATIALTMQAWRESRARRDFGGYYIHVNIPAFHAEVRDDGRVLHRYRVIVGRNSRASAESTTETPEFSDRLERMVFNPFWHLPQSIIENEVIPAVIDEPDYIEKHNYEVRKNGSRIFIKQRPGPGNALGQVKFLFPNQFAIYMHDTPTRRLFTNVRRAYSHGCVRVHEPMKLATLLMEQDRGWSHEQSERFIQGALDRLDEDTVFHLDTPVPIHLEYLLSRVDEHGFVEFFDDIYDRKSEALDLERRRIGQWLDLEI